MNKRIISYVLLAGMAISNLSFGMERVKNTASSACNTFADGIEVGAQSLYDATCKAVRNGYNKMFPHIPTDTENKLAKAERSVKDSDEYSTVKEQLKAALPAFKGLSDIKDRLVKEMDEAQKQVPNAITAAQQVALIARMNDIIEEKEEVTQKIRSYVYFARLYGITTFDSKEVDFVGRINDRLPARQRAAIAAELAQLRTKLAQEARSNEQLCNQVKQDCGAAADEITFLPVNNKGSMEFARVAQGFHAPHDFKVVVVNIPLFNALDSKQKRDCIAHEVKALQLGNATKIEKFDQSIKYYDRAASYGKKLATNKNYILALAALGYAGYGLVTGDYIPGSEQVLTAAGLYAASLTSWLAPKLVAYKCKSNKAKYVEEVAREADTAVGAISDEYRAEMFARLARQAAAGNKTAKKRLTYFMEQ